MRCRLQSSSSTIILSRRRAWLGHVGEVGLHFCLASVARYVTVCERVMEGGREGEGEKGRESWVSGVGGLAGARGRGSEGGTEEGREEGVVTVLRAKGWGGLVGDRSRYEEGGGGIPTVRYHALYLTICTVLCTVFIHANQSVRLQQYVLTDGRT